jgi:predicted small secreted protein
MIKKLQKILIPVLSIAFLAALTAGCHTTEGFGKDVKEAGSGIEKAAK